MQSCNLGTNISISLTPLYPHFVDTRFYIAIALISVIYSQQIHAIILNSLK